MHKVIMASLVVLMVSGCSSTKTVYPTECSVVSTIPVEKADPAWLVPPQKPQEPTEEQLNSGATNSDALNLISENNQMIWQQDRDKLRSFQAYYNKLVEKGVIK